MAQGTVSSSARAVMLVAMFCAVVAIAGCGPKGPQRYEHWGTITFQDKPIPNGLVYFDPDTTPPGNDGPQGVAVIKDGKYDTRLREDSGSGTGRYVIRVYATDGVEAPEAPAGRMIFSKEVRMPQELPAEDGELNVVIPPETR